MVGDAKISAGLNLNGLNTGTATNTVYLDVSGNVLKGDVFNSTNLIVNETPSGLINSSNTAYTIANTPVTGKVTVFLNGLKQKLGVDYTISGTTLTMLFAPTTGDDLSINYPK